MVDPAVVRGYHPQFDVCVRSCARERVLRSNWVSKLRVRPGARGESNVPRSDERGQSLAELALVVTIILVMAIAVFDLSLAFYNSTLIVQGARDGARRT